MAAGPTVILSRDVRPKLGVKAMRWLIPSEVAAVAAVARQLDGWVGFPQRHCQQGSSSRDSSVSTFGAPGGFAGGVRRIDFSGYLNYPAKMYTFIAIGACNIRPQDVAAG